jgi:hypothetical protein
MDQEIRNKVRNVVTKCRKLLEDSVAQELEGKYGIFAKKDQVTADPNAQMTHLTEEEQAARKDILDHFGHIKARGFKPKEALDQLVREIAFTHLNRLCSYKMMEVREVYVGGRDFVMPSVGDSNRTDSFSIWAWKVMRPMRGSTAQANKNSPTGIFWTGWVGCFPMKSACCSTLTTRPTACTLGRRRLMKCWTC